VGQRLQQTGFTFVELLIAATMMSILFVGLATHLRGGLSVWHHATETVDALQRQRVALDRFERDLANAIVYDDRETSYGADEGELPWPQFGQTKLGWFTVLRTTKQHPPAVRFVTYTCEQVGDTQGLWRTSQSVGEARATRQPTPELLLPGCEGLSARYAYLPSAGRLSTQAESIEWHDEWADSEKALPRLVEVSIQLGSGGRVTRVFAIPAGALTSFGPPPA
jgi:type II secretory pathway pseudopilin PulG